GGTAFQPVFDYVEAERLDPLACVYFTDLYGPAPEEPPYPVLWVAPIHARRTAPFGREVRVA
uniref:VWA-like domain-containing protein n=1 Tax=Nevskia soli TaxID=418856 RepID=UPI00214D7863